MQHLLLTEILGSSYTLLLFLSSSSSSLLRERESERQRATTTTRKNKVSKMARRCVPPFLSFRFLSLTRRAGERAIERARAMCVALMVNDWPGQLISTSCERSFLFPPKGSQWCSSFLIPPVFVLITINMTTQLNSTQRPNPMQFNVPPPTLFSRFSNF